MILNCAQFFFSAAKLHTVTKILTVGFAKMIALSVRYQDTEGNENYFPMARNLAVKIYFISLNDVLFDGRGPSCCWQP